MKKLILPITILILSIFISSYVKATNITLISPINTTYNTTIIELNVTSNDTIDTWWYNLNSGSNVTFTPNITITAKYGLNHLIVYANDTSGNINQSEVYFTTSNYIDKCSVLNEENMTYYLTSNISDTRTTYDSCFVIKANNITFNCQNNEIGHNNWLYGTSISVYNNDVIIENCIIHGWYYGIGLHSSNNTIIKNNKLYNNYAWHIKLYDSEHCNLIDNELLTMHVYCVYIDDNSNYVNITNNTINGGNGGKGLSIHSSYNNVINNSLSYITEALIELFNVNNTIKNNKFYHRYAIYTSSQSSGNVIYDNIFYNTLDIYFGSFTNNVWNTTKHIGTNIIGRNYIGGNYYDGWSDDDSKCNPIGNDGICNNPYILATNNIDYLPLTYLNDTTPPEITINSPKNITYTERYTYIFTLDFYANDISGVDCISYSIDDDLNITNCSLIDNKWITSISGLSEGQHNIKVYANDTVGNTNSDVIYFTFKHRLSLLGNMMAINPFVGIAFASLIGGIVLLMILSQSMDLSLTDPKTTFLRLVGLLIILAFLLALI